LGGLLYFCAALQFYKYYKSDNIEYVWGTLKQVLKDAILHFVPQLTVRKKQNPEWFTPIIKHQINYVHSLRRKYKKNPTDSKLQKLQAAESNLQALMAETKCDFESNLIHNFANRNHQNIFHL